MAEEKISKGRGGYRPGSGRKPIEGSKKHISVKMDYDLMNVFSHLPFTNDGKGLNRGRYICEAVREKMQRDGLITDNEV